MSTDGSPTPPIVNKIASGTEEVKKKKKKKKKKKRMKPVPEYASSVKRTAPAGTEAIYGTATTFNRAAATDADAAAAEGGGAAAAAAAAASGGESDDGDWDEAVIYDIAGGGTGTGDACSIYELCSPGGAGYVVPLTLTLTITLLLLDVTP